MCRYDKVSDKVSVSTYLRLDSPNPIYISVQKCKCLYWALSLELCTSNFLHMTPAKVLTPSLRNSTIGADYIVERKHEGAVAVGIRVHSGDEDLRGRIGHRRTENDEGDADGGKRVRLREGGLCDKIICHHPKKRVGGSFIATMPRRCLC